MLWSSLVVPVISVYKRSRRSWRTGAFSSHPQTTKTRQPRACRSAVLSISRCRFRSSFLVQKSQFDFDGRYDLHPSCMCQKQPLTKTTVLYFARTMSGVPGYRRSFLRKRRPLENRKRRTTVSICVSLPRTRDMTSLRFSFEKTSATTIVSTLRCGKFGSEHLAQPSKRTDCAQI